MKSIFLLFTGLYVLLLQAQQKSSLVDAENQFAEVSRNFGVKTAFLNNIDSASVVFVNAEPALAQKIWLERKSPNWVLDWQPAYTEINNTNNWGYTTGPYKIKSNSNLDSVLAEGSYFTIWRRNSNGKWVVVLDDGIETKTSLPLPNRIITNLSNNSINSNKNEWFYEKQFEIEFSVNPAKAYANYLSTHGILYRDKDSPAWLPSQQQNIIRQLPGGIIMKNLGGSIINSGDFSYVYGRISGKLNGYFIHVWRHEKTAWKLAAEVLHLK